MKKIISLLLAVMLVVSLAACGGNAQTNEPGNTEGNKVAAPASALEILEKVWDTYTEDEMFPVVGGDSAYHAAQMDADENYMMPSAPGKFALTETDELTFKMLVPETEHSKLTDAATMTHMMNGNNFSCGVYRLAAADVDAFVTAMKTAVTGNQWMCGMPESLLIATVADEYVLVAWGIGDAMNPFETKFVTAYPEAKLVVDEAIVG